jgi:hypothetical protein
VEKIPNIVRQRLAAQQSAGEHPDADLLTALAEQRLSGTERQNVLAHLSRCSACREIAAIAAPESDLSALLHVREVDGASARPWWAIPTFQWGAAAAAVAMIAVGLFVFQPGQKTETVARNATYKARSAEPTSPTDRSDKTAPAKQNNAPSDARAAKPDQRARVLRPGGAPAFTDNAKQAPTSEENESQVSKSRQAESSSPYFDRLKQFGALSKDSQKPDGTLPKREAQVRPHTAGTLSADANSQTVEVTSAAPAVQTSGGGVSSGRGAGIGRGTGAAVGSVANTTPVISAANDVSNSAAAPAAPPAPASATAQNRRQAAGLSASNAADELAVGQAGPAVGAQTAKIASAVKPAPGTWRITSGRLQHFDGTSGAWNDIDVGSTARLSIVTTLGPEVWVGGTDGAMFYSNDQGAHWIPTSTGGWSADATITGMTPTARRSVEVYFSNGERWRSADGGASWTRYQ